MNEYARIEAEVDEFLADRRHLDYQQTEHNQQLLLNWLEEHGLTPSAVSLHEGYLALRNELDLDDRPAIVVPVVERPPAPSQPPAPIPAAPSRPGPRAAVAWRNGKAIELTNPRPL